MNKSSLKNNLLWKKNQERLYVIETYICERRTDDTLGRYEDIYRRCFEFAEESEAIAEEKYLKIANAITDALRKLTPSAKLVYSFSVTSDTMNENMEIPIIKDPHPINRPDRPPTNRRKSTREKVVAKYF